MKPSMYLLNHPLTCTEYIHTTTLLSQVQVQPHYSAVSDTALPALLPYPQMLLYVVFTCTTVPENTSKTGGMRLLGRGR